MNASLDFVDVVQCSRYRLLSYRFAIVIKAATRLIFVRPGTLHVEMAASFWDWEGKLFIEAWIHHWPGILSFFTLPLLTLYVSVVLACELTLFASLPHPTPPKHAQRSVSQLYYSNFFWLGCMELGGGGAELGDEICKGPERSSGETYRIVDDLGVCGGEKRMRGR